MWRIRFIKYLFLFRLAGLIDVIFSNKFEINTYSKDGMKTCSTKFDRKELKNACKNNLL